MDVEQPAEFIGWWEGVFYIRGGEFRDVQRLGTPRSRAYSISFFINRALSIKQFVALRTSVRSMVVLRVFS